MVIKKTREEWLQYHRDYYQKNRERLIACSRAWKEANPERYREMAKRGATRQRQNRKIWRDRLRVEVLTYYGNGKIACVQCGFSDIRALSIDHVNNDGAIKRSHRRDYFMGGIMLYLYLRRNDYPLGYQTLCFNCNTIKHREYIAGKIIVEPRRKRGKNAMV